MLLEILGSALIVFGIIALVCVLEDGGRKKEQNKQMKQVLDDIDKANSVRDRLDHDAAFAKRVRKRFTR